MENFLPRYFENCTGQDRGSYVRRCSCQPLFRVGAFTKGKRIWRYLFFCEFPPNHADSSKYMNWRQMQELDRMGFEVVNHTHTHAQVGTLSKAEIREEIAYIERKADSLGMQPPSSFAYPGYSMSEAVLEVLREKQYRVARAGGGRVYDPLSDHPYLLPSWATDDTNEQEIFDALKKARGGKMVILTTLRLRSGLYAPWSA